MNKSTQKNEDTDHKISPDTNYNIISDIDIDIDKNTENKNLTFQQKLSDFIEDNENLGCGLISMFIVALFIGGCSIYQRYESNKIQEQKEIKNAQNTAHQLESDYIKTLLPLTKKLSDKNGNNILLAAEYIMLIDHPDKKMALDILEKKYEQTLSSCQSKIEFQNKLLEQLDAQEMSTSPLKIQIKKSNNPYVTFKFKETERTK